MSVSVQTTRPLPSTVVKTDQGNTYSTGAQNFTSATSLIVPASGGYAPTADASIGYDTTQDKYVAGGAGAAVGSFPRVVFVGNSTTDGNADTEAPTGNLLTDDTSTTTETDFALSYTVPANVLITNKAIRLTFMVETDLGASPPGITFRLRWGGLAGTIIFASGSQTGLIGSAVRNHGVSFVILGTAAAGAAANVLTFSSQYGINDGVKWQNQTAQPVAVATNASAEVVLTGQWASNAANTHKVRIRALIAEELN